MPDDHRPPKRTRLPEADPGLHVSELTSSQGITDFEQHEDSWLPDGNIALVVNQTTAFRIYRGLIACQPTVFEDMFTASTSNSDELFDACPAVHLSDSPQNLAHLLRILLPKSQRLYVYPPSRCSGDRYLTPAVPGITAQALAPSTRSPPSSASYTSTMYRTSRTKHSPPSK